MPIVHLPTQLSLRRRLSVEPPNLTAVADLAYSYIVTLKRIRANEDEDPTTITVFHDNRNPVATNKFELTIASSSLAGAGRCACTVRHLHIKCQSVLQTGALCPLAPCVLLPNHTLGSYTSFHRRHTTDCYSVNHTHRYTLVSVSAVSWFDTDAVPDRTTANNLNIIFIYGASLRQG